MPAASTSNTGGMDVNQEGAAMESPRVTPVPSSASSSQCFFSSLTEAMLPCAYARASEGDVPHDRQRLQRAAAKGSRVSSVLRSGVFVALRTSSLLSQIQLVKDGRCCS